MHVTPNQDFDGVEGDLEGIDGDFGAFHRGVRTVDVDARLSSVLAGAFCSTGPDMTEGVEGGARVPSTGLTVMKGVENIVWGVCPSSLVPSKGLEAGCVQIKALANVSRFCKASSDGRRPRTRVCSFSSRHAVRMTQGSDITRVRRMSYYLTCLLPVVYREVGLPLERLQVNLDEAGRLSSQHCEVNEYRKDSTTL